MGHTELPNLDELRRWLQICDQALRHFTGHAERAGGRVQDPTHLSESTPLHLCCDRASKKGLPRRRHPAAVPASQALPVDPSPWPSLLRPAVVLLLAMGAPVRRWRRSSDNCGCSGMQLLQRSAKVQQLHVLIIMTARLLTRSRRQPLVEPPIHVLIWLKDMHFRVQADGRVTHEVLRIDAIELLEEAHWLGTQAALIVVLGLCNRTQLPHTASEGINHFVWLLGDNPPQFVHLLHVDKSGAWSEELALQLEQLLCRHPRNDHACRWQRGQCPPSSARRQVKHELLVANKNGAVHRKWRLETRPGMAAPCTRIEGLGRLVHLEIRARGAQSLVVCPAKLVLHVAAPPEADFLRGAVLSECNSDSEVFGQLPHASIPAQGVQASRLGK
mmetsp:Transcript_57218/g.136035  ORF Transcript_57218/g.136035 Transcript_57218/m.136035 type:complete len:387 (+) Transcript_57218:342-1502(+)